MWILMKQREWQWHQLGYMQVCTLLQTDNHASTPPLSFFTGWMPFLPPNQQRQSTEGNISALIITNKWYEGNTEPKLVHEESKLRLCVSAKV